MDGLRSLVGDCIPNLSGYQELPSSQDQRLEKTESIRNIRAVAMSGMRILVNGTGGVKRHANVLPIS